MRPEAKLSSKIVCAAVSLAVGGDGTRFRGPFLRGKVVGSPLEKLRASLLATKNRSPASLTLADEIPSWNFGRCGGDAATGVRSGLRSEFEPAFRVGYFAAGWAFFSRSNAAISAWSRDVMPLSFAVCAA